MRHPKTWPKSKGALTRSARRRAAQDAGLSLHQYRRAIRVSNIPRDEFECLIESDNPPSIGEIEALGRRRGTPRGSTSHPCPHCGGTGRIRAVRIN